MLLKINSVLIFQLLVCKNDKHQTHELLFGDPLEVVELPRNSEEFFLLQRIQDEVHRFAITFHRQVRSKIHSHQNLMALLDWDQSASNYS